MPTADQIKALLTSHAEGDSAQFYSIAMQIAAGEARQGRGKLAEELRSLIDKAKAHAPSAAGGRQNTDTSLMGCDLT